MRPSPAELERIRTELLTQRRALELQLREVDSRIALVEAAIRAADRKESA